MRGNHFLSLRVHYTVFSEIPTEATINKRGFFSNSSFPMASDDSYERLRQAFDDLDVEKRARFLIEASASTLAAGLEQVGHVVADGLEDVMQQGPRSSDSSSGTGPGPAEPETAQRQAPTNGPSSET